ncbi:hypothetical protein [Paenibacillus glycanilyticus]|uniref:hypothetical protein n=1 Tax=Paenibacillus glycanilyticus TaxID=126569 RepID=UPI000FDC04C9|nr:hypothetical protein [Paenibacillus glycanilyticus]
MEKAALSLDQPPMARIAHIEKLGKKNAIAFYEWGTNPQYFGIARLKKTIFGWHFTGGSTSAEPKEHKFGWSFYGLKGDVPNYAGMYSGKIYDPEIASMWMKSRSSGKEQPCRIIEYGAGERFWFYLSEQEEGPDTVILARSQTGEILEQYPSE